MVKCTKAQVRQLKSNHPVSLSITHNSGFVRSSARWGKLESKESLVIHC